MDFKLVKWKTNYLDDFIYAMKDPHLSDNMCETLPYPMDTAFAVEYISERMLNSEERQVCRAIQCGGHIIGGVDVVFGNGVYEKSAELSVWIIKEYRCRGLGTAAVSEMCRLCFETYDILRIEARPYSNHIEAVRALKKAGFIHEGTVHNAIFKNNKSYNYEIFALLR